MDSVQEPDRISADADVAVGQQDVVPLTRPGHRAEDITQHRLCTARPCLPHALSGHVDAHRDQPASGQGAHQAPRTAADVQGGPRTVVEEQPVVALVGVAQPVVRRQGQDGARAVDPFTRDARERSVHDVDRAELQWLQQHDGLPRTRDGGTNRRGLGQ